jgi:hypothetical protein
MSKMLLLIFLLIQCVYSEPIAYRIAEGSEITINNMISNYTYFTTRETAASPSNITLSTRNGAVMIPIVYTDVYYLLYNVTTNETDTKYISLCDPIPNRDPSTLVLSELGVTICPTHYECIVTDLRPDASYKNWPDLRACLLNFTITDRTDLPILPSGTTVDALVMNMDAILDTPTPETIVTFGVVDCNDFIARSLNCQWTRQLNTYQTQCLDSPVPCYSRGIGKWFGAFFEQNPLFRYTIPRANWTEKHYQGIASTMNYKMYYEDGALVDPLTSLVLDDYYWIPDLQELEQKSVEFTVIVPPVPDFIQALGLNWVSGVLPLPVTELTAPNFTQFVECILLYNEVNDCPWVDWFNSTSIFYRYPAAQLVVTSIPNALLYSVTVRVVERVYGIEVYDAGGVSCGKYMQEIQPGINVTFQCLSAVPSNGTFTVFLHYKGAILDVVGKGLATPLEPYYNVLNDLLTYGNFAQNSYLSLLGGVITSALALFFGQFTGELSLLNDFPNRVDPEFISTVNIDDMVIVVNYTDVEDNAQFLARVAEITTNIRSNNSYPRNYPLELWVASRGYTGVPFNYANPDHLDMLYRIWSTWYFPRQSGSEAGQCQTSVVGETVYPVLGPKQFWFNGDSPPGYDIPQGTAEGGCLCNNTLNLMEPKFFCAKCIEGYGPETLTQWGDVLQSNRVITQVIPAEYPFTFTSYTDQQFQELFLCKFPFSPDPITGSLAAENICSGHGLLAVDTTVTTINVTQILLNNYWVFPLCNGLLLGSKVYTAVPTQDPLSQQFLNGNNSITIIEESVFLDGEACLYTKKQETLPPYGSLSCTGEDIACLNDDLFSSNNTLFNQGRIALFNTWLGYFR